MASWFASWIPSLPSIDFALPSALQRRFISFVLKRTLGHLLKPGQLNAAQIESQIGSGSVQINDLELDNAAVNSAISGLPIKLYDGSIGSVTARIPWPNPLTSTLGFSVQSLHLVFHITPNTHTHTVNADDQTNLAESVASVADSFYHDELNAEEEASLKASFHPDILSSEHDGNQVPGSLDPFLDSPKHTEDTLGEDPSGVSIFASLIERLLARLAFDASDVRITLVHPDHSSITLCVDEIVYGTEKRETDADDLGPGASGEQNRNLSITGFRALVKSLSPRSLMDSPSLRTPRHNSKPPSPASSSSSLDDETQMMMSQSLAFLPPRPSSPSESMSESMYKSAVSTVATGDSSHSPPATPRQPIANLKSPEELKDPPSPQDTQANEPDSLGDLIFAFDSEPIVIRLTTPSAMTAHLASASASAPQTKPSSLPGGEQLRLTLSCGVLVCALGPHQVNMISDAATLWASHKSPTAPSSKPSTGPDITMLLSNLGLEAKAQIRGVMLLLLHPNQPSVPALTDFFSRPLAPIKLSHGFVRLYIEKIALSSTISTLPPLKLPHAHSARASSLHPMISSELTVHDLSVFIFSSNNDPDKQLIAFPILITDPNLVHQYPFQLASPSVDRSGTISNYASPPKFDVADWTDPKLATNSAKVSAWRSRRRQSEHIRGSSQSPMSGLSPLSPLSGLIGSPLSLGDAISATAPAIRVSHELSLGKAKGGGGSPENNTEVTVVPLHIFADLALLLNPEFSSWIKDAFEPKSVLPTEPVVMVNKNDSNTDLLPSTPIARNTETGREKERQRLERLVLDDLDLEMDYRDPRLITVGNTTPKQRRNKRNRRPSASMTVSISLPMIRVQIRCPPPRSMSPRSGAMITDFHEISLRFPPEPEKKPGARFVDDTRAGDSTGQGDSLVALTCKQLVASFSLPGENRAAAFFILGQLVTNDRLDEDDDPRPSGLEPLRPALRIKQLSQEGRVPKKTIVLFDVPCINVQLTKPILDGVQLWADDITQLSERIGAEVDAAPESENSRDSSLIGSRFFAKSRGGSRLGSTDGEGTPVASKHYEEAKAESVVKVSLSEAFVRLSLPRQSEENSPARPLDIVASDIDVLVELKPEGKDQSVFTVDVMELNVLDTSPSGRRNSLLSRTSLRNLTSNSRPLVGVRFTSVNVVETATKESRVRVGLSGFTFLIRPKLEWTNDLATFFKAPPGAFESVVPSERTSIALHVSNGSVQTTAPNNTGSLALYLGDLNFATEIVGGSPELSFTLQLAKVSALFNDDLSLDEPQFQNPSQLAGGLDHWKAKQFVQLAEIAHLDMAFSRDIDEDVPKINVEVNGGSLNVHLCADTMGPIGLFIHDLTTAFSPPQPAPTRSTREPSTITENTSDVNLTSSLDEEAFKKAPDVGPAPDMINDDLPSNMDYLDESFSATAGLRELNDDDLLDFENDSIAALGQGPNNVETINVSQPIEIVEDYFETLPPESSDVNYGRTTLRIRVRNFDAALFLYDGYDWGRTRRTIENEVKEMRKRLAKIRQLVASGQTQDPSIEDTSALLFNSVHIGLEESQEVLEPGALIAAIDEELMDDFDGSSQSSWQSLKPGVSKKSPKGSSSRLHKRQLFRSKAHSMEFRLMGLNAEVDRYRPGEALVSRIFATVRDIDIFDHIKTSTWRKFLTALRADSHGNIRETGSNMLRVELLGVYPVPGQVTEEARLRAKLLPLRLHVDQDALDFLKVFFSFKDPSLPVLPPDPSATEIYFQHAEVFPVGLKLDFKPRRVDYRALREGRTIELMNFFHFDGAEMTLRHITLAGVTGWPRFFDLLNDLWTPDVKATQLVDVISGVAPIRSVVNFGSGVADLVLLPIAQYKKDGRIVRGMQKGTKSFVKSTAMEAVKLGARLATGTQVILEQTENVLGGRFESPITAEALQLPPDMVLGAWDEEVDEGQQELISRYAEQPEGVGEGLQTAYQSLRRNLNTAAQTILAVPMEVYERSGTEGPVRSVIRAVPIAVLRPMIGASEAVSKTLMGLHNTMDPNVRLENEDKYKQR